MMSASGYGFCVLTDCFFPEIDMSNDDTMSDLPPDSLSEAVRLAEQTERSWSDLGNRHVRVVRAVVYEGPASWFREQLARSMPVGVNVLFSALSHPSHSITISQGPIEVLADDRQEPLPFTKDQP